VKQTTINKPEEAGEASFSHPVLRVTQWCLLFFYLGSKIAGLDRKQSHRQALPFLHHGIAAE